MSDIRPLSKVILVVHIPANKQKMVKIWKQLDETKWNQIDENQTKN